MHVIVFVMSVCLALGLLILVSFLPQEPIWENVNNSLQHLYNSGIHPRVFDYSDASILDQSTDVTMLRASAATSSRYIGSVLTNPIYTFEHETDIGCIHCLELLVNGYAHNSVFFYARYWMGFRILLRPLLTFLTYFQIRRYFAFAVLLLFVYLVCDISKNLNHKIAFFFALSFVLVRPQIVVNTVQFCICFLIAFTAMLFVPWLSRHTKYETLFFMELGIITMYFDFYTVPLITLGLPLIYLYCMRSANNNGFTWKKIALILLSWFAGYALMWVAKLCLTTILTDVDGISNGLNAFASRMGVNKNPDLLKYYSVAYAFEKLFQTLVSDSEGCKIIVTGLLILVCTGCVQFCRRRIPVARFGHHKVLLMLACLPFAWFAATAQPIAIHSWFQYRSITITYWALGIYFYHIFQKEDSGTEYLENNSR